jgi:uncharacterized protein (DUF3084 family)
LAILCALALAAVGASWFALISAKAMIQKAGQRTSDLESRMETTVQTLQTRLEKLSAEMREAEHQPAPVSPLPAVPRPGMNLTTRSQVLRLNRRGETVEQISKVLAVPRQEVELLLKVHRIVLGTMEAPNRASG